MANLEQFGFHLLAHTDPSRCFSRASLHRAACAVVVLGIMLPWLGIATAQQEPSSLQTSKEGLEIEKLQPEVAKLKNDRFKVGSIGPAILGVVGIGFTIIATFKVTRLTLHGALDQSVHDKRLESYPGLWNATAPLALYFPSDDPPPVSTGPRDCRVMGRAISKWYFGGGGLLLSVDARDAYFRLARALTRASAVEELRVPIFPMDAEEISQEKVSEYREKLGGECIFNNVEVWPFGDQDWPFGNPVSEKENAHRFRDFIFLQYLSSDLRTKLTEDLRSRQKPS